MATLTKLRARKPLFVGRLFISYGSRIDVNNGDGGIIINTNDEQYTLRLTDAELDRMVEYRAMFDRREVGPTTVNADNTAIDEIEKDRRDSLTREYQLAKALGMAILTLKAYMPKTEQPRNATLAYLEKVMNNG